MQPDTTAFRLNGLVTVNVEGPASYRRYFENEYARMEVEPSSDAIPKITLKVVDEINDPAAKTVHYKELFNFRFATSGMNSKEPTLVFERHWLDRFYVTAVAAFVQGQLLEPIIYQKLLERGILFMHAAGVSQDGKAFVFPAEGGTGKTTLSMALMQNGYELMGDDLLMVDANNGMVFPYARPLHLFTYNLKTISVPFRIRMAIATKDLIRAAIALFTGKRFLISTRAHAEEIFETRRSAPAKLSKAIFLKRDGEAYSLDTSNREEQRQAIDAIIASADLNLSLEENIGMPEEVKAMEKSVIGKVLSHVDGLDFINARKMNDDAARLAFARERLH